MPSCAQVHDQERVHPTCQLWHLRDEVHRFGVDVGRGIKPGGSSARRAGGSEDVAPFVRVSRGARGRVPRRAQMRVSASLLTDSLPRPWNQIVQNGFFTRPVGQDVRNYAAEDGAHLCCRVGIGVLRAHRQPGETIAR